MDPISIAMGLAQFAPGVVKWLKGDSAEGVANQLIDVAGNMAGTHDPLDALEAIQNDVAMQADFQQAIAPIMIAQYEAESKQLAEINATIRAEINSTNKFKSYWRPLLGYIVAIAWGVQMLGITVLLLWKPTEAVNAIKAIAELSIIWGVALSILGINVTSRSKDKQVAVGQNPGPGLLGALVSRIAK